jgi:signal transduction histidine kinase
MATVLLVADDEMLRMRVAGWLHAASFEVALAEDGAAGIGYCLEHTPDLILCLDEMSPVSGFDVLTAIRVNGETLATPFVMLSARRTDSGFRRMMRLGADDVLYAPLAHETVIDALRVRLERKAALEESVRREVDKLKINLARVVAHELKTPLVNIALIRQIIERQVDQLDREQIKDLLASLSGGTDRLSHLVEQMVFLTQLDTGVITRKSLEAQPVPVEMWQLIPPSIDLARRYAFRNKQLSVRVDERDRHVAINGHLPSLKHALAELISNALNFSFDESAEPEATQQQGVVEIGQWKTHGAAWIAITDHGAGMSDAQQRLALTPFDQVDRNRNEQQGIGMGLPLAKRIIELHGGKLDVRSVPGKGTQIIIQLPLLAAGQPLAMQRDMLAAAAI